jgi:hypothetical protein
VQQVAKVAAGEVGNDEVTIELFLKSTREKIMKSKILFLLLAAFLSPLAANATLLGRVNSYYDPTAIQNSKDANAEVAIATEALKRQKNAATRIIAEQEAAATQLSLMNDEFNTLGKAVNAAQKEWVQATDDQKQAQSASDNAIAAKEQKSIDSYGAVLEAKKKSVADKEQILNKLNDQFENARLARNAAELNFHVVNSRTAPSQKEIDATQAVVVNKQRELTNILKNDIGVRHSGTDGVKSEFVPSVSVSTVSGGGTAIDLPAYQYTIPFMKSDCDSSSHMKSKLLWLGGSEKCDENGITGYRMLPMYVLVHKTVISAQTSANGAEIAARTLANDILDNEHGGLVNLKFTPSFFDYSDSYAPHISVIGDVGYKFVEQPLPDLKTAAHLSGGYAGLGVNVEFSVLDKTAEIKQLTDKSIKPAGYLALGVGAYRNTVNGVDNTFFTSPVPRYFNSYFAGGELQITNFISFVFSRVLPTSPNPLGSFTSISIKYQTPSK